MGQPMRVLQHEQLPPESYQLAETYQLGTPQEIFRVKRSKRVTITAIILFVIGAFLGFSALGSFADNDPNSGVGLLAVAVLLFAVALYMLLRPLFFRSWRVYVCSDGFAYTHGRKVDAFRWNQIEALWQRIIRRYTYGIYTGTSHKYTIRRQDGYKIALNDKLSDVETLGNRISNEITKVHLPLAIATYNAGNTLSFGVLSLSSQGLSNGKELLPWNQIKGIGVNRGYVAVKKEGKLLNWSTVQVARIPNFFVLMALVDYILKGQPR